MDTNVAAQLELNEWLDQLNVLSKELDGVRPSSSASTMISCSSQLHQQQQENVGSSSDAANNASSSSQCSSSVVRAKIKPALPPKPQIDSYRYSMANIQESADVDLDVLLGELCALESQLNDGGGPAASSRCYKMSTKITISSSLSNGIIGTSKPSSSSTTTTKCVFNNGDQLTLGDSSRLSKMELSCRPHSPDNDSAFCDNLSTMSSESVLSNGHRSRDSNASSSDSTRGSMTTPSPTQLMETVQAKIKFVQEEIRKENLTDEEQNARLKAEKIKIALEKMKEASVRKLYVKIFSPNNGSSKSILIDERWTVSYILRQLAEKNHVALTPHHAIVENYPDLHMERIYEDHEHLVENILLWSRGSSNKLYFVERLDKNDVCYNPQRYLLGETEKETTDEMSKRQLLDEFFGLTHVQPPEVEGVLYLKTEGKKAWKKHYFVLRSSGLYYIPKGKSKSSKDLVCLMQLEMAQIYNGIGWKKKYKAPTDFGFALKHPQIQIKASRYIKYLCVEDEKSYNRWMTGLRLAKHGKQLYDNFEAVQTYLGSDEAKIALTKMRNSTSTDDGLDYCKQSIVIRPRPTTTNGNDSSSSTVKTASSMVFSASADGKDRPRSADIVRSGSVLNAKRGSRQLMQVDSPAVPVDSTGPPSCEKTFSPSICRRNTTHSIVNCLSEGFVVASTADDVDFRTSTIKKQPTSSIGNNCKSSSIGAAHLPLTESTRQIHSRLLDNQQQNPNRHNTTSSSIGSSLTSVDSKGSTEEEPDSDEELPPPPDSCIVDGDAAFPPPPSPLPAELCQDFSFVESSVCTTKSSEDLRQKSSLNVVVASNFNSSSSNNVQVVASSSTFCEEKTSKKSAPPPPKRSENTRLTTSLTGPSDLSRSKDFSCNNNNIAGAKSCAIVNSSKPKTTSATTNAAAVSFHSELQRATFRRLQQLQQQTAAAEQNSSSCNGNILIKNNNIFTNNNSCPSSLSTAVKSSIPPPLPPKKVFQH